MKPSEQLRAMASEMERRPWCRGEFTPGLGLDELQSAQVLQQDPNAPCCGEGAALALWGYMPSIGRAMLIFRRATGSGLPTYNDKIATCKEDVLQMLRKAANLAEREGQ